MESNFNKFLPIGSVILLKGSNKPLMIIGFCCKNLSSNLICDYSACLYPEGFIAFDKIHLFNHDQIDKVISLGYIDETSKNFHQKLLQVVNS